MAAYKVYRIVNKAYTTSTLNPRNSLLEQTLTDSSPDQRLAYSIINTSFTNAALLDIFPFLSAGQLSFSQWRRSILQQRSIKGASIFTYQTKDRLGK
ncbi:MAG TPA: hypothetical protein VMF06_15110 [Candidatus Limnocylindria bacterium]|nr:hypothetical protein [Candidatus Limnocylindria bacterium]